MSFELPFELPTGWQVATVDELVKRKIIARPLDGNHGGIHPKASDYVESGVPFVMASDLSGGQVNICSCKYITKQQASSLRKGFTKAGDVLLSHKATIGRTAIVQASEHEFMMLTPQVTYYRVLDHDSLSNVYLKSYFDSRYFQAILSLWAGAGSTRAYLGITEQLKLPIILPPIEVQNEISGHVTVLNRKITLNNEYNQTLEKIAQTIFQSWFIYFEPVYSKMNGEPLKGMDAAISSMFSGKLVESKVGLIPEGWEIQPLDKIAHFQNGLALQSFRPDSEDEDFLPVLKIADLRQGYCTGNEKARTDIKESCRVDNGDMIFSWSGTLMIDLWTGGKAALNQHLFKVSSDEYSLPLYLYWTKHHLAKFQQIAKDKAVTMGHIKRVHLSESLCVVPPKKLRDKMDEILTPLINQGLNLRLQSNQLATLRDTILPKFLSGEIRLVTMEAKNE